MARRRKYLGAADDVHEYQTKEGLARTTTALRDVEAAARDRNCGQVWDELLIARANLSHAYAHIGSFPRGDDYMNQFFGLQNRLTSLRDTLGFQCTRKGTKR